MFSIEKCPTPAGSLLSKYSSMAGAYTDCYTTGLAGRLTFPEFIFAFYTTPLFKLERFILLSVSKPSTDTQARQLADAAAEKFAAWTVETHSGMNY